MLFEHLKPLFDWLHLHPHYAALATFMISFAESLAIVGALVPGIVLMTAIGTLIGSDIIPAWEIFLAAITGAIIGDVTSFWLGHHYHEQIRDVWPFYRFPYLLEKGEVFFKRHGGKSVFLGRFAGPVRAMTPLIAGMLNMPVIRFLIASITASPLWALAYMLPGILLGAASQELAPDTAKRFLVLVVAGLLLLWCISWLLKRLIQWFFSSIDQGIRYLWLTISHRPSLKFIYNGLQRTTNPDDHQPLAMVLALITTISLFLGVSFSVYHKGTLTHFNQPILHLLRSLRNSLVDHVMIAITFLGETKVLVTLLIAVFSWLLWQRFWRTAYYWLINGLLAIASTKLIKALIHSPRPDILNVTANGWSFPSGHTTLSIAFFGFLAMLASRTIQPNNRWLVYVSAGLTATIIAISRLYLNAHWFTDVLGGLFLGLSCVLFTSLGYFRRGTANHPHASGILFTSLLSLVLAWGWYFTQHYQQALYNYSPLNQPIRNVNLNTWWSDNRNLALFYRTNRFGKPIQAMNIEWLGDLSNIEKSLTQHGWIKLTKMNFTTAVNDIVAKDRNQTTPILSDLYQNNKPALTMTKYLPAVDKLLVIRLWQSNITLTNSSLPLWLGTINYHRPWNPQFLSAKSKFNTARLTPALFAFEVDLPDYLWKQVAYPDARQLPIETDWNGYILLIRPIAR